MNWLPVNGGPLNGGYSSALVAASAAAACSSLVASVAVRAQEALSAVYSEAKITVSATLPKSAGAALWCGVDVDSIPVRVVEPAAIATTDVDFAARPYVTTGEPANRTFFRQKTATSFFRSASITEFRRQA